MHLAVRQVRTLPNRPFRLNGSIPALWLLRHRAGIQQISFARSPHFGTESDERKSEVELGGLATVDLEGTENIGCDRTRGNWNRPGSEGSVCS